MEDIGAKGLSRLPLIMLALAMYVGYQTFFPSASHQKVYLISPATEYVATKDTIQALPANRQAPGAKWLAMPYAADLKVRKARQDVKTLLINKPAKAYLQKPVPREEVVKNLLEQGESKNEIERQTGLQKKEIRKIIRKKKAAERKDKKQRKKMESI